MRKVIVNGAVVTALIAISFVPAFAQKYDPAAGSGNLVQGPGGPPVTPDTPAYIGQRNGEAYNYRRSYDAAPCRDVIRHEFRNGHRIAVRRTICR